MRSLGIAAALAIACGPAALAPREEAVPAASSTATDSGAPAVRFVRAIPAADARSSVDACAYASARGSACIDALVREPDPVRVRYMHRLHEARRVGGAAITRTTHAEIAECCNREGPCGADKRSGHADCPQMDDGYACLVAAELLRIEKKTKEASAMHGRACRCDATRAQTPAPGGTLACEGPSRPAERRPAFDEDTAREILSCATCDREKGPAACEAEASRLQATDPQLAGFIERVVVTRCQLP